MGGGRVDDVDGFFLQHQNIKYGSFRNSYSYVARSSWFLGCSFHELSMFQQEPLLFVSQIALCFKAPLGGNPAEPRRYIP